MSGVCPKEWRELDSYHLCNAGGLRGGSWLHSVLALDLAVVASYNKTLGEFCDYLKRFQKKITVRSLSFPIFLKRSTWEQ